ncbi:MAG: ABC transporter substrate-binding protein [Burkholderiales bacterium]|nr:ABC transporter substrate-binding protein [Burkholderiales bacterium]
MRKFFVSLLLLAGVVAYAADAAPAPEQLIRTTSREVVEAIKKDNLTPNDKRFKDLIETKALPNFDFGRLTQLAVGRYWRDASADQQASLTREFRTLLVRTYSAALTANKIQNIDVKPVKMADADTDVTVRTEVTPVSGQPVPIDYRLIKVGASWKVYDVAVEGASLVTTYRSSFNQTIQKDGIDGLIRALADRNATQPAKVGN